VETPGEGLLALDANGDGISTANELSSINDNDIVSINLNDVPPGRFDRTRAGNSSLGISNFAGEDGFDREVVAVGFRTDQTNTRFIVPDDFEYDPSNSDIEGRLAA
jgi:hypothetical protein